MNPCTFISVVALLSSALAASAREGVYIFQKGDPESLRVNDDTRFQYTLASCSGMFEVIGENVLRKLGILDPAAQAHSMTMVNLEVAREFENIPLFQASKAIISATAESVAYYRGPGAWKLADVKRRKQIVGYCIDLRDAALRELGKPVPAGSRVPNPNWYKKSIESAIARGYYLADSFSVSRQMGLTYLKDNKVTSNMGITQVEYTYKVKDLPKCSKRDAVYSCTYDMRVEYVGKVLGSDVSKISEWVTRTDNFVIDGDSLRSRELEAAINRTLGRSENKPNSPAEMNQQYMDEITKRRSEENERMNEFRRQWDEVGRQKW